MRRRHAKRNRGFTLVELLVVIGIIAVLIGVLLPVLSGIAARGRDLQCQSNIRQCVTLILNYAGENKGQLPFGMYWARGGPNHHGWGHAPGEEKMVTVWSVISNMSARHNNLEDPSWSDDTSAAAASAAPFMRCPEALQVQPHLCGYSASWAAFISPWHDAYFATVGPEVPPWKKLVDRQTKLNQCSSFTALIWDTSVSPLMASELGIHFIGADIDDYRIWGGAACPQQRYYSPHDPFGRVAPFIYGNNRPILLSMRFYPYRNIDPPDGAVFPYEGNLRFRHRKNTSCNVGYADGHVGQFTGKFKSDGTPMSHDAIRKSFMVKWPSGTGIAPDPTLPH
jgi:prepilin-type N-terminal cleavage/methylation domain-containing protein/prepilin-type processing-associated H-X9-DG protein